jgi:hypothetical protein
MVVVVANARYVTLRNALHFPQLFERRFQANLQDKQFGPPSLRYENVRFLFSCDS